MCTHSSSGYAITQKIGYKLYPFIDQHFCNVVTFIRQTAICNEAAVLFDHFYALKSEFESLKNYDLKLIFPSVLKVFNTKDNPAENAGINIRELQELAEKKEKLIAHLVTEMEGEAEQLGLPQSHPIHPLLFTFRTMFIPEKKEWNNMLQGWNSGCACFAAASKGTKAEAKNQDHV